MRVQLTRRSGGAHDLVREADIPGTLADYAAAEPGPLGGLRHTVNEDRLAAVLPEGFLPVPAPEVMLGIDNATQSGLTAFRDWDRHSGTWMLWLRTPGSLEAEGVTK
jgi:hypothetical protein